MKHKPIAAAIIAAFTLTACETSIQTTSGADYLARYDETHSAASYGGADVDADVRRIASIEPTLQFPARIGLARIDRGRLVGLPSDEAYIWQQAAENLGPLYGEFVPVSPLITAMVSEPNDPSMSGAGALIADIRRGAARQHLDYVMVYEVGASKRGKANALSLADLTVIGMFVLPSRSIDVEASASGLMLDVRTGYPYATLTTHAEKSGISRAVSEYSASLDLIDTATERAVAKLAAEFENGMEALALRSLDMTAAEAKTATETSTTPQARISPMERALSGE